jgi:protein CpxP
MKRLMVGILSVALMGVGLSVYAHQQEMGMQNGTNSDRSQMMNMHDQMGKTENLMQDIQSNKKSGKRQEMMHEHMKQMRMGMDMMHGGNMMEGKKGGGESGMHMDSRMEMMEQRMGMMQRMMRQMMEHQSQQDMPMNR